MKSFCFVESGYLPFSFSVVCTLSTRKLTQCVGFLFQKFQSQPLPPGVVQIKLDMQNFLKSYRFSQEYSFSFVHQV